MTAAPRGACQRTGLHLKDWTGSCTGSPPCSLTTRACSPSYSSAFFSSRSRPLFSPHSFLYVHFRKYFLLLRKVVLEEICIAYHLVIFVHFCGNSDLVRFDVLLLVRGMGIKSTYTKHNHCNAVVNIRPLSQCYGVKQDKHVSGDAKVRYARTISPRGLRSVHMYSTAIFFCSHCLDCQPRHLQLFPPLNKHEHARVLSHIVSHLIKSGQGRGGQRCCSLGASLIIRIGQVLRCTAAPTPFLSPGTARRAAIRTFLPLRTSFRKTRPCTMRPLRTRLRAILRSTSWV